MHISKNITSILSVSPLSCHLKIICVAIKFSQCMRGKNPCLSLLHSVTFTLIHLPFSILFSWVTGYRSFLASGRFSSVLNSVWLGISSCSRSRRAFLICAPNAWADWGGDRIKNKETGRYIFFCCFIQKGFMSSAFINVNSNRDKLYKLITSQLPVEELILFNFFYGA